MTLKDLFLLPNLITLSRLFVSIYLFNQYSIENIRIPLLVTLIAAIGISDSIDGIVARRLNQVSKLGTILDPVCDRIVFLLLLFWLEDIFPIWFFYGILTREILVSGLREFLAKGKITMQVTSLAKMKTFIQMTSIAILLTGDIGNKIINFQDYNAQTVGIILLWLSAFLTLYTGYDYLRKGIDHAINEDSKD